MKDDGEKPQKNGGKVIPMEKPTKGHGRAQSKSEEEKPPKIPLPQIQYALLGWMAGTRKLPGAAGFPDTFRTIEIDRAKGVYTVLEIDENNLATEVHHKTLRDAILKLMARFEGDAALYCLPIEKLESLSEIFMETKHGRQIPMPPIFTFESEKSTIAFNRVPNPNRDLKEFYGTDAFKKLAPLYSDFIRRCSEPLAVRQFFGTLLHPRYHGKQSLHLWGDSNAGKSTFVEVFLQTLCGKRGYEPVNFDTADPFRLDGWSGKLALFADEMDDDYYHTLEYKRITNSAEQKVNLKHIRAHKQLINAKLIATSNPCPSLPTDNAVTNRIVLCKVEPLKKMNNDLEELNKALKEEMPYILADMEYAFSLLGGKPIAVSDNCHEEALSIYSAPFQEFFDRYFVTIDNKTSLLVADFKRIIVQKGEGKISYKEMREFVRQKYGSDLNYKSDSKNYVSKIALNPRYRF